MCRLLQTFPPAFFLCFLVFGNRLVGEQDLRVRWAGVAKLVLRGSILQITRQTLQLAAGDVVVAVLLTHHLRSHEVHSSGWSKHQATDGGPEELLRYLHNVQLGKEAAVRQGQRVAVQEAARRHGHVRVLVQLAGQRRLQVGVELPQGGVELLPQP